MYAMIFCWLEGVDGIGIARRELERLLGLKRFKKTRVEWLMTDLKELFPYQIPYWSTRNRDSIGALIIARKPIEPYLAKGALTLEKRLVGISDGGPRLAKLELWSLKDAELGGVFRSLAPFLTDRANYDERLLSAYLALLAQGQIRARSIGPLVGSVSV